MSRVKDDGNHVVDLPLGRSHGTVVTAVWKETSMLERLAKKAQPRILRFQSGVCAA